MMQRGAEGSGLAGKYIKVYTKTLLFLFCPTLFISTKKIPFVYQQSQYAQLYNHV